MDDEQYIVRLIGQVITVSLETQKIVKSLPGISPGKDEIMALVGEMEFEASEMVIGLWG